MLEKNDFVNPYSTQTGRTSCRENMIIAVFSCINFELTSIKQTILNKHESTQRNTCYK